MSGQGTGTAMADTGGLLGTVATGVDDAAQVAAAIGDAAGSKAVSDLARLVGSLAQRVEGVDSKASSALATAQDAHAAATAAPEEGGLLQEVVDFLHRLFPGHGAPGAPSEPKAPAA